MLWRHKDYPKDKSGVGLRRINDTQYSSEVEGGGDETDAATAWTSISESCNIVTFDIDTLVWHCFITLMLYFVC